MNYVCITNKDDFENFQTFWENFYLSLETKTVFQTFSWNYLWWSINYQEYKPSILVIYENNFDKIYAIFPLMLTKKGRLRFIADTHSDYNNILMTSVSRADLYEIGNIFYQYIHNNREVSTIELKNITYCQGDLGFILSNFHNRNLFYNSNASSSFKVSGNNFASCFAHLKAKKRNKLKRLLNRHSHLSTRILSSDNNAFPETIIREIAKEMIIDGVRDANFLNQTLLEVIKALYNKRLLLIHEVYENNRTLVMNFILHDRNSNKYLMWISVFRNIPRIHIVSYLLFIDKTCSTYDKYFIIDLGRGLYEYKTSNFLPEIHLQFTFFYAKKYLSFIQYILKKNIIDIIKPFYKKHKKVINRILKR